MTGKVTGKDHSDPGWSIFNPADIEMATIVRRRFGRDHETPCARPETLTCARWECQAQNRCVHAVNA